jgi:hypothetical protein
MARRIPREKENTMGCCVETLRERRGGIDKAKTKRSTEREQQQQHKRRRRRSAALSSSRLPLFSSRARAHIALFFSCAVSLPRASVSVFLSLCGLLKRPVCCGKRGVVSGRERAKHHVG